MHFLFRILHASLVGMAEIDGVIQAEEQTTDWSDVREKTTSRKRKTCSYTVWSGLHSVYRKHGKTKSYNFR